MPRIAGDAADELNPPPLLTGDDLIAHGVPRGKEYHTLLEAVRDAQLNKTISTRTEALALVDCVAKTRAGSNSACLIDGRHLE